MQARESQRCKPNWPCERLYPLVTLPCRENLLHHTGDRGKHVVRVGADEPDGSHDKYQDHRKHHCVLGDVLPVILLPCALKNSDHMPPPADASRAEITRRDPRSVGICLKNGIEGWVTAAGKPASERGLALTPDGKRFCARRMSLSSKRRLFSFAASLVATDDCWREQVLWVWGMGARGKGQWSAPHLVWFGGVHS